MYYENLKAAVNRGAHDDLVELDVLWSQMGLQEVEIKERMTAVEKEIRRITHNMVKCEEDNIKGLLSQCKLLIEEERILWSKLSTLEPKPIYINDDVSLMEKLRRYKSRIAKLKKKEVEVMERHRSCFNLMEELARKLGAKVLDIDVEQIPNSSTIRRLDKYVEELKLLEETRENKINELRTLWDLCMIGTNDQGVFESKLDGDCESALVLLENEVARLHAYYEAHKPLLKKINDFLTYCELAADLKRRTEDPKRLFNRRGGGVEMLQEEKDRNKIKLLPSKKGELMSLLENTQGMRVKDFAATEMIENEYKKYLKMFPSSSKKTNVSQTVASKSSASLSRNGTVRNTDPSRPKKSRYEEDFSHDQSSKKEDFAFGKIVPNILVNEGRLPSSSHRIEDTISEREFSDNVPMNSTECQSFAVMVPMENIDRPSQRRKFLAFKHIKQARRRSQVQLYLRPGQQRS